MRAALFALSIVFCCAALPARAQQLEGAFGAWSAFTHDGLCYIGSSPAAQKGDYARRGEPYLLVTSRGAAADEVSASPGYPYQEGKDADAAIDGKPFKLFTRGEVAWAYDEKQDKEMVTAMKRGKLMTVRGVSRKGSWSEDAYSLKGFSAAYQKMKSLCK